jgi:YihY family inner membrane protein
MSAIKSLLRRIDERQQRTPALAFPFAVVKKFGDDRGGSLAALMAYYGFLALFPMLLLLVTLLGLALQGNESLQESVKHSALSDFPIIGDQLSANIHSLRLSGVGLAISILGLLWGSLGVTQAAQHAMAQVWNVEGKDRPGFLPRFVRGLLFVALLGLDVALIAGVAELGTFGPDQALWFRVLNLVVAAALNVAVFIAAFRLLTPKQILFADLVPGAVIAGIAFTLLQIGGTYLVTHQLKNTSQVYGFFAIVLGLLSWLYLSAQITLYAAEINVVRVRRLWPRSLVQPPLTEPDRRVLRDMVEQEIRRPEQRVEVGFDDSESDTESDAARNAAAGDGVRQRP